MKRFYKDVEVVSSDDRFEVHLDGKPVRTPAKASLSMPRGALAAAIAAEWDAQGDRVEPASMPLMALACTAIDLVAPKRAAIVGELAAYGAHDLICYWADNQPTLRARQQAAWQPLLDWAALQLDAPLVTTAGVVSVAQPPQALAALRRAVSDHDDFALTALRSAAETAGSLVIGLAVSHEFLDAERAFQASQVDETHQMEHWGRQPEAVERQAALRQELADAARFMTLLRA